MERLKVVLSKTSECSLMPAYPLRSTVSPLVSVIVRIHNKVSQLRIAVKANPRPLTRGVLEGVEGLPLEAHFAIHNRNFRAVFDGCLSCSQVETESFSVEVFDNLGPARDPLGRLWDTIPFVYCPLGVGVTGIEPVGTQLQGSAVRVVIASDYLVFTGVVGLSG